MLKSRQEQRKDRSAFDEGEAKFRQGFRKSAPGSRKTKIFILWRISSRRAKVEHPVLKLCRGERLARRLACFAERPLRMNLIEKLPEMTDEGVNNLLANARRLEQDGTPQQQAACAEALPAIEAEAARRLEARKEVQAQRRADAVVARKATAARKTAAAQ